MADLNVISICGSLRKGSFNRMMARNMVSMAPASLKLEIVEIRDLDLYDQDREEAPPAPWLLFRERIRRADAVLFVTPEYNRSVPGVLKNAIDVGSRPYGKSAWEKKPAAVISVSPGAMGGFGANHHLRQSLVFLDMPAMQQPEAYIANASKLFDTSGALTNDDTKAFVGKFLSAFEAWVGAHVQR
jgi:chromate reductase